MIEQNLAISIKQANDLAVSQSHEYISSEHILYTLTFDKEFIKLLEKSKNNCFSVRKMV